MARLRYKTQVIFRRSSRFRTRLTSTRKCLPEGSLFKIKSGLFRLPLPGGRSPQDPDDGVGRLGNLCSLSPKPLALKRARNIMIKVKINGKEQSWDGDPALSLLWFLRDEVGLTGAKFGCGQALCGACTVMVDGQAVRSCITAVSDAAGREVTTIEGLHPTGDHVVQKAWRQVNVPQCGFFSPGRSCRPLHCCTKIRSRPTTKFARPWRATSAAAAAISGSKRPCNSHRRGCDHEFHRKPRPDQ